MPGGLEGAVLTRDVRVQGERWGKGRRLSPSDLALLAGTDVLASRPGHQLHEITVLRLEHGDLHEDEAALRLADAVVGPGLACRGPTESRIDVLATVDGVLRVRTAAMERVNAFDTIEVFSTFDGKVVTAGELVASVKVALHVVPKALVDAAVAAARRGPPLIRVAPFRSRRVGVLVMEALAVADRERFERTVREKVESLGSTVTAFRYLPDDAEAVEEAVRELVSPPQPVHLILTAGAASTDPLDPMFQAIRAVGGRLVRQGVPAHPGSMLWVARIRRVGVLGLPSCGAYSRATAADLLLPRLLTGESVSAGTVARLGHGGLLTREMRYRFPAYERTVERPGGA